MAERVFGFEPLMCDNPKILILGTIPGKSSIAAGEYYFDGSNRMWKVIAGISGEVIPSSYVEKVSMLAKYGIVLWDYYHSVVREDSSDKGIISGEVNDIPAFLRSNPSIKIVAVLGYGKWKLFGEKLMTFCNCDTSLCDVRFLRLPETSGMNARWSFDRLCNDWKCIFE